MHLHLCRRNPSYTDEHKALKCQRGLYMCCQRGQVSQQLLTIPARAETVSKHGFSKPFPCQRVLKNAPQLVLTNALPCRRGNETCLKMSSSITHPMPARTLNVSQVLTKPLPSQRGHKMYLNVC